LKELKTRYKHDIDHIRKDLANKAEKELLLENQKQFFVQLSEITSKTDQKLSQLVSDEMRKVTEANAFNMRLMDKKFQKLTSDIDIDKMNRTIASKLSKDDAEQRFSAVEVRLSALEKG
jgi:hypothetical protein